MKSSLIFTTRRTGPALLGGLLAAGLVLAACSSADDADTQPAPAQEHEEGPDAGADEPDADELDADDAGGDADAPAGGAVEEATAIVAVDGREFVFELTSCMLYLQDDEAGLEGLGGETGSDVPAYLDGSSVAWDDGMVAEFRIDIGADGPWQSTDDFISLGTSLGGDYEIAEDGDTYVITADAWDDQGSDLGSGTITFAC